MILKGRRKITSEYKSDDLRDVSNLINLINYAHKYHIMNKVEIDYLIEYKKGIQPILYKEKIVRDEINNKIVANHADMITRTIVGYFLGTPIQYIQNGDTDKKEQIDLLNQYVAYEDKASVDKEIGEYQSICGTAYRIIYTDGQYADEVPFEDKALNPATTYIVYENDVAEKPIVGVTFYNILDLDGQLVGVKLYAYTEFGRYEIFTKDEDGHIGMDAQIGFQSYDVGGVPIIEYPNNIWRIGDWELYLSVMDAMNNLHSGRFDDIDQIVQSLLIFINADIDSDVYDEMREKGIVLLKNMTGQPTDVKQLTNSLDQSGMNTFSTELESLLYALVGIPDRNNRAGGGGDTGQAVELRDGWADLEIVARNKELCYKKSEKQALRIILYIMNTIKKMNLSLLDVDIKFSRNKNNNLLVKTQSLTTMLQTKVLSPADCLTIVDLVSDVNEYISRGEEFWQDAFAGRIENQNKVEMSSVNLENAKNPQPIEQSEGNKIENIKK